MQTTAYTPRQLDSQVDGRANQNAHDSPYSRQLDNQVGDRAAENASDKQHPRQLDPQVAARAAHDVKVVPGAFWFDPGSTEEKSVKAKSEIMSKQIFDWPWGSAKLSYRLYQK